MKPARAFLTGALLMGLLDAVGVTTAAADSSAIDDAAEAEHMLAELREQLRELEQQIERQVADRGAAEQSLRSAEKDEAVVRRKLVELGAALATAEQRLEELEAREEAVRADLARRVGELERQIRAAYVSGQDDWLRSVLSQRDPAEVGRQLVYHSYLARHRSELVGAVRSDLDRLEETQRALQREREDLDRTRAAERERLAELSAVRDRRAVALAEITASLATRTGQAERLRSETQELEALVAELSRILTDLPIAGAVPFGARKGQMAVPADGRIVRKFGQARANGRLRWEGILVGAPAGEAVRAVHHGRVVYADWLPGMGLLVVLEHGDGFLSLYGHNQDVVTEVGEWVDPGAVIAHVGDSGGQAVTGLYFEIRKNGQPQDPAPWLRR